MCEAQNLIMAVEQYPCIWDLHHADYHNRDIKDLAWEHICKEVYNDWETCTDKSNKCAELKKKWTNIRDYYRKELQKAKNVPTGSAAKKAKTYVYSELLYFLTPVFTKRDSEGNYPKEDSESIEPPNEERNVERPEAINQMESPEPTLPVVNPKRKKDVPTQLLNMLQQKQKQSTANIDEDDDTKYLLSFRSYMKTMNAHQKIDFKVGMLQLVKKVSMGNDPSPFQSPYTNHYHYSDDYSGSSPAVGNSLSPSPTYATSFQNLHMPKKLPIYLQRPSPSPPTCYPFSQQQNISSTSTSKPIIYVPKKSPIYLQSPSPSPPTFYSSSQQQNVPHTNTSRKPIIIHSIANATPPQSTTQQSPVQNYPELSVPETINEDSEAAQFLVLQSEDLQQGKIEEFVKFK